MPLKISKPEISPNNEIANLKANIANPTANIAHIVNIIRAILPNSICY